MANENTENRLNQCLDKIYKIEKHAHELLLNAKNEKDINFNEGYLKGIKDTTDLIKNHIISNISSYNLRLDSIENKPRKLFQLEPEEILKLDLKNQSPKNYTVDEFAETAFNLENQLLELLGDVNSMPFDSYTALSSKQLVKIIINSAEGICRFNKKQ